MGFLEPENSKFFSARFKNFLCQINLSELAFLGEVAFLAFGVGWDWACGLVGAISCIASVQSHFAN